jgi:hypothetical protein
MSSDAPQGHWPALPLETWRDTYETLHMWTQVLGKVCLALTPRINHFWNVAFEPTARGLATPSMMIDGRAVAAMFDFVDHQLVIERSDGRTETLALEAMSVADFYRHVVDMLDRLDVRPRLWTMPVEVPGPIRFEQDTVHRSYVSRDVSTYWQVVVAIKPVFDQFRAGFLGKSSPFHFFWGSFDLALTRFSGRTAPERPGADPVTKESYSHEVISHGFWPGSGPVQEPAFYAYAAPEPPGLKTAAIRPAAAYYHHELSEFILPYDAVRGVASPTAELEAFLESTYNAAADLGGWDRAHLERPRITR